MDIGKGSYGIVRRHRVDFMAVAVKDISKRATYVKQALQTEATILAKLDHKNIVRVFGGGNLEAERPFIVMELCEESLSSGIRAAPGPAAPAMTRRVEIVRDAAAGCTGCGAASTRNL